MNWQNGICFKLSFFSQTRKTNIQHHTYVSTNSKSKVGNVLTFSFHKIPLPGNKILKNTDMSKNYMRNKKMLCIKEEAINNLSHSCFKTEIVSKITTLCKL